MLVARIVREDLAKLQADSLEALLASAKQNLPLADVKLPAWNYIWDLILANPAQLAEDFRAAGRSGIEAKPRSKSPPPFAAAAATSSSAAARRSIRWSSSMPSMGRSISTKAWRSIPSRRIEGPCYVGRHSVLLGAKCREGNSIGPMCRIGGEVEESIIQGYSNKYHDGFLGHAYVGQWVNLGALTTNSDLKNDYSDVKITLDGRTQISTGSTKVGALIGDHAKTSIGTLLNTGACVGAMTLLVTSGKLLPKFIPSFTWHLNDAITLGIGKASLYATARTAMGRRKCQWTEADEAMWNAVYETHRRRTGRGNRTKQTENPGKMNEIRNPKQIQNATKISKQEFLMRLSVIRILSFEFVSDFDIRISHLRVMCGITGGTWIEPRLAIDADPSPHDRRAPPPRPGRRGLSQQRSATLRPRPACLPGVALGHRRLAIIDVAG